MQVCNLIYPPLAGNEIPYLAGPMLVAYCKEHGLNKISQYDLNAQILDEILTGHWFNSFYNQLKVYYEGAPFDQERFIDFMIFEYLIKDIDLLKREFKCGQYTNQKFWDFHSVVNKAYELIDKYCFIEEGGYKSIILDKMLRKVERIVESNPSEFFAVSVCFEEQFTYAIILGEFLKKNYPEIKIIIGGPFLKVLDNKKRSSAFRIFDYCIIGEGYDRFLNILFNEKDLYVDSLKHPNALPCPDFEGLNFNWYMSSDLTLPIYPARGCYWNRCVFCNISLYEQNYMQKNMRLLVNDILSLKKKYECNHFYLSCDTLSVNYLVKLSEIIYEQKLEINWQCEMRLEQTLNEENISMFKLGGCYMLRFGLESGSKKILNKMRKGIEIHTVERSLKLLHKYHIKTSVYLIIDFPGETMETVKETEEFLYRNRHYIDYLGVHIFEVQEKSYIYEYPDEFEGVYINDVGQVEYQNHYIKRENILKYYEKIMKTLSADICVDFIPSSNIEAANHSLDNSFFGSKTDNFTYVKKIEADISELDLLCGQEIRVHIPTETVYLL